MKRFVAVFAFTLAACQGTLETEPLERGTSSPVAAATTATTATSDVAGPTTTATAPSNEPPPNADPASTVPAPEPEPEPDPEVEPMDALPTPGSVVEFTIVQGTAAGAWNEADAAVVVYVGQVLKVTNFDDRDHEMHASDNAPVPHGGRLRPGQSEEYVVSSALEVGGSAQMWEHGEGRSSAPFWVEAREYPAP